VATGLTPEVVRQLEAQAGIEFTPRSWIDSVTADAIRHFASGVGDDNPLWWDSQYAQAALGSPVAPPTLANLFTNGVMLDDADDARAPEADLDGVITIWRGDDWTFQRWVKLGERLEAHIRVEPLRSLRGEDGQLRGLDQFQVATFRSNLGDVVAERRRVVRRYDARAFPGLKVERDGPLPYRYSRPELDAIAEQYGREPGQRRGGEPRYWDDVRVGDSLGQLVKGPLTVSGMVGWVLGTGTRLCVTNRLAHQFLRATPLDCVVNSQTGVADTTAGPHWDTMLAAQLGMPSLYDFGGMRIDWLSHLLTDWCGDRGRISALSVRLRRPDLLGDTTWLSGEVTQKHDGQPSTIACVLRTKNQLDQITAEATATVELPRIAS
jgi:acyl dehydratase